MQLAHYDTIRENSETAICPMGAVDWGPCSIHHSFSWNGIQTYNRPVLLTTGPHGTSNKDHKMYCIMPRVFNTGKSTVVVNLYLKWGSEWLFLVAEGISFSVWLHLIGTSSEVSSVAANLIVDNRRQPKIISCFLFSCYCPVTCIWDVKSLNGMQKVSKSEFLWVTKHTFSEPYSLPSVQAEGLSALEYFTYSMPYLIFLPVCI